MPTARPINVVVRALSLLRALNLQAVSSLDVLHKRTAIPKPTLVRLLQTLESEGLVARAPQYGTYYLTSGATELSSGYHSEPRIVEASARIAEELTADLKWPVSIAVPDGDAMVVRYSTIPHSPLSFFHSTINMRLSFISQAMGRAYVAFCDDASADALIHMVAGQPDQAGVTVSRAEARELLTEVRERGYALRDVRVRPESSSIAVPVFDGDRVVASLGLTWFSSALATPQAVERFLPHLQRASKDISRLLTTLKVR